MLFMIISSIVFSQQYSGDTLLVFVNKVKSGSVTKNIFYSFKKKDMVTLTFTSGNHMTGRIDNISINNLSFSGKNYNYQELSIIKKWPSTPGSKQYSFCKMHYKVLPEAEVPAYLKTMENDTSLKNLKGIQKEIFYDQAKKKVEKWNESPDAKKQRKEDNFFMRFSDHRQNKVKIWLPYIFINEFFASFEMRVDLHNAFEVGAGYLYDYGNYVNTNIPFNNFLNGDDFNHSPFGRNGFIFRGSYMHYGYRNFYIGAMAGYKYTYNGNRMVQTKTETRYANYWINQSEKSHIFTLNLLLGKQFMLFNRASIDVFIGPGIKLRYGNIVIDGKYRENTDSHGYLHYLEGNYPVNESLIKVYPDLQLGIKLGFAFGKKYKDYMK